MLYGTNWNANYYAYGEVAAQSGSEADNKYTFTGKECDCSTGLRYYGWRYYDPQLGRFLTLDPESQGWSPYAYAGNNPVIITDPDGRFAWFVPILIGAGLGAVGGGIYAERHGGEWWQGALADAVFGGAAGYFIGAAAGITPPQNLSSGIERWFPPRGGWKSLVFVLAHSSKKNPCHHAVVVPKPVTPEVAALCNIV